VKQRSSDSACFELAFVCCVSLFSLFCVLVCPPSPAYLCPLGNDEHRFEALSSCVSTLPDPLVLVSLRCQVLHYAGSARLLALPSVVVRSAPSSSVSVSGGGPSGDPPAAAAADLEAASDDDHTRAGAFATAVDAFVASAKCVNQTRGAATPELWALVRSAVATLHNIAVPAYNARRFASAVQAAAASCRVWEAALGCGGVVGGGVARLLGDVGNAETVCGVLEQASLPRRMLLLATCLEKVCSVL